MANQSFPNFIRSISGDGTNLYGVTEGWALEAIDFSDPLNLAVIGRFAWPSSMGEVQCAEGAVHFTVGNRYAIAPPFCESSPAEVPLSGARSVSWTVTPNPSRADVHVSLGTTMEQPMGVRIVDARGRAVNTLTVAPTATELS